MFGLPERNTHEYEIGTIGDVVKDVHYGTAKKASEDGRYIYIRMNNITYDGDLDLTDIKRIDVPEKDLSGCMVQEGDVLFNRTNSKDLVGKTCHFTGDEPMIIAGYIIRLRMNGKVLPEYVSTFMNLDRSKKLLYSMAKGAVGQANINAKEVQSIPIVIPPENLQQEFLKLRKQSDKSKFVRFKSQFIEMFGDPTENPNGWTKLNVKEAVKQGYIARPLDGNHGEKHPKGDDYVPEGVPFLMAQDLKDKRVDFTSCHFITEEQASTLKKGWAKEGDVLLTHKGTIGRVAIVQPSQYENMLLTPQITYYRCLKDIDNEYLAAYFMTGFFVEQLERLRTGTTRACVTITQQEQLELIIPPVPMQREFVKFVNQSDKSK